MFKIIHSRLLIATLSLGLIWLLGKNLDWEAERVIQQRYLKDKQGIIVGLKGYYFETQKSQAIIFIHGFLDTPEIFKNYFDNQPLRNHFDIAIPRLRYHAKNLQTARHFNNAAIEKKLLADIQNTSKQHQHTTIVAQSYAGALTLKLLKEGKLPQNSTAILVAPALFIKENNFWGNLKLYTYSLWRNYCNYPQLGCQFPGYNSGDASARAYLSSAINLGYLVIPALKQLFQFDSKNRTLISTTAQNFHVLIAKNDNRIDYEKIAHACQQNPACHLYTYPSGRHLLQRSKFSNQLLHQIQEIIERNQKNLAI